MKAVVAREPGGPEVLQVEDIPTPEPGPQQIRIRVAYASLNPVGYVDPRGGEPVTALLIGLGKLALGAYATYKIGTAAKEVWDETAQAQAEQKAVSKMSDIKQEETRWKRTLKAAVRIVTKTVTFTGLVLKKAAGF